MRSKIYFFLPALLILGVLMGCSGGRGLPTEPAEEITIDSLPLAGDINQEGHLSMGSWDVKFDLQSKETAVIPCRFSETHYNVLGIIPPPEIKVKSYDPVSSVIDIDVTLTNSHDIHVFDVRLIIYTDSAGHELINCDDWTALFDIPGGYPINPFKAYAKNEYLRWFAGLTEQKENLQIRLPGGNTEVAFAVDASYPTNCPEPYEINSFTQQTLYDSQGHSAEISVKVFDRQGDANLVQMFCPQITNQTTIDLSQVDSETWSGTLTNATGVPMGEYTGFIIASSADSGSLCLYDRVEIIISESSGLPVNPRLVGQFRCLKDCDNVFVNGDYLFSVDSDLRVSIFDINQLPKTTIVSEIPVQYVYDIAFKDNYAFLASSYQGLKIYDLQEIESPTLIYDNTSLTCSYVEIHGDILFCVSFYDVFRIFDISLPSDPIEIPNSFIVNDVQKLSIYNQYLVVQVYGYGEESLMFLDISDPYNLVEVTRFEPGFFFSFDLKDNLAWLGCSGSRNSLRLYDITDINDFHLLSEIFIDCIVDVSINDNLALVLTNKDFMNNGISIVDITDTIQPQIIGHVTLYQPEKMAIGNNFAFVSEGDVGLSFIDVRDPSNPFLDYKYRLTNAQDVLVREEIAWLVARGDGIMMLDTSDKTKPMLLNEIDTFNDSMGLEISGSHVFIAQDNEIEIYDISDMMNPVYLSSLDVEYLTWNIKEKDGYLFVPGDYSNFRIADVHDPSNPSYISTVDWFEDSHDLVVEDGYAYVSRAYNSFALRAVDISDPYNPVLKGYADVTRGRGLDKKDNYIFLAHYNYRFLDVIDVTDPDQLVVVTSIQTNHVAGDVAIQGNYAYVAGFESAGGGGLEVIDISDPLNPEWVSEVIIPGAASCLDVENEYVYIAAISGGLQIIKLWD